jgi:hypothetical protein
MFSNKEMLLCNAIQTKFRANTINRIDHNIAGCKHGAGIVTIKHGVQKNELTLYIYSTIILDK